jgi:ketosteroid isomerase-like protein
MPEGNAEIVRALMDAWNRGDWDEVFRRTAADIVIDNSMVQGEYRGVHRGPAEVRRMFERFTEPWESVRIGIEELVEAGEHVFTRMLGLFRGRDGIELTVETGVCWTFRDGVLSHVLMPNEVDEAREAAGLPLS